MRIGKHLVLNKPQLISGITSPIITDKGCVCLDVHTFYYVKKNISIQCSESVDTVGVYKEALQIL